METLLAIGIFAASFFLLSVGVIFAKKGIRSGSCGSGIYIKGEEMSCGACPSKEAELCPSGDKDGYATLAQLGNPGRKKRFKNTHFSAN
jgi:hypothetical protein